MQKDQSSKVIALVALLVSVVGLSLGFASFSTNLVISSKVVGEAEASDFKVFFSKEADSTVLGNLEVESSTGGARSDEQTNVSQTTVNNAGATFTAPGQSLTYKLYARNVGGYDAFLNSITFENAAGGDSFKKCEAAEGSNPTLAYLTAACNAITVEVRVGNEGSREITSNTLSDISSHSLPVGANEEVYITINYPASAQRVDGNFIITFGQIKFKYETAD